MNEAGHRGALEELRASRAALDPTRDVRRHVEATHGMAVHAIAAGFWRRHGVDLDQHQGMARRMRDNGYAEIARAFADLEQIRTGRWYGGQGNGDASHRVDGLLARVEAWSVG